MNEKKNRGGGNFTSCPTCIGITHAAQLLDSKYTRAQYMALKALPNDYELACWS